MKLERLKLSQTNRPMDVIKHWHIDGQLLLDPPYQRGDVWGYKRQANLIRSILLGVPIPSIIINDRWQGEGGGGRRQLCPKLRTSWGCLLDADERMQ